MYKEFSKTTSTALHAWSQAKESSDFSLFAPHLAKIVALCKKKAELLTYQDHPYDALLDLYEPGMTVKKLSPLFSALKTSLLSLLQDIRLPCPKPLPSFFDPEEQMKLGKQLLKLLGFSQRSCRIDLSSHPFCLGIHPKDTRITSRIFPDQVISHILSTLHESGHALYNMQLPQELYGTPLCEPASYGIDESQSRLWETFIGRSLSFWSFFYPNLQQSFPQLALYSLQDFYHSIHTVTPSCIRVEADEVTYSLHIILRFEIEKALFEGLSVQEIPSLWNQKMKELLGIIPSQDKEGCLQDIHWAMGAFGYFPSYALGNLFAAQLFETLKKAFPLEKQISQGNFQEIRNWLNTHIHQHGKLYLPDELIEQVTHTPLQPTAYIQYLQDKYLHWNE